MCLPIRRVIWCQRRIFLHLLHMPNDPRVAECFMETESLISLLIQKLNVMLEYMLIFKTCNVKTYLQDEVLRFFGYIAWELHLLTIPPRNLRLRRLGTLHLKRRLPN